MINFIIALAVFFMAGFWPAIIIWFVLSVATALFYSWARVPRRNE